MLVLLVSADGLLNDTVSDMLTVLGHIPVAVRSPLLALGALTAMRFDVCLLLDARHANVATAFIHQAKLLQPNLPFITEKIFFQEPSVARLVHDCISKPFNVETLAKSMVELSHNTRSILGHAPTKVRFSQASLQLS